MTENGGAADKIWKWSETFEEPQNSQALAFSFSKMKLIDDYSRKIKRNFVTDLNETT